MSFYGLNDVEILILNYGFLGWCFFAQKPSSTRPSPGQSVAVSLAVGTPSGGQFRSSGPGRLEQMGVSINGGTPQ